VSGKKQINGFILGRESDGSIGIEACYDTYAQAALALLELKGISGEYNDYKIYKLTLESIE
jgi:hypothetical protein